MRASEIDIQMIHTLYVHLNKVYEKKEHTTDTHKRRKKEEEKYVLYSAVPTSSSLSVRCCHCYYCCGGIGMEFFQKYKTRYFCFDSATMIETFTEC